MVLKVTGNFMAVIGIPLAAKVDQVTDDNPDRMQRMAVCHRRPGRETTTEDHRDIPPLIPRYNINYLFAFLPF